MITIKEVTKEQVELMILPVFEGQKDDAVLSKLNDAGSFKGAEGEIFALPEVKESVCYILYTGLGKREDFTVEGFKVAIANAVKKAKSLKVKTVGISLCVWEKLCVGGNVKAIAEAATLAQYEFSYQTTKTKAEPLTIYLTGVPQEKLARAEEVLNEAMNIAQGVCLARDLTNEPSNILYPETLASRVVAMGEEIGLEVEVMDENQIKALGMEAFLAVGGSSTKKPRLIVMRYRGDETSEEVLGLVGKGLTYDTGGYSIKPTASMLTMYSDMGGAAAVIGAMYAICKNKVKKNIIGVVAACENVISADAYKPGDIIKTMAGKTIEIVNTDAEGRLTLADAVTYIIEKEKVTKVIDLATLTGAALSALGTTTTAVVTNDEDFYNSLQEAAAKSGEAFWQLPSTKVYKDLNKSKVADLKNAVATYAGTITAGLFVGEFVQDLPWIHLDIAGTAWTQEAKGYMTPGATGTPVRTLCALVTAPCGCHHNK